MTVRPYRTMLPPIWVAACDSQRRRNAPLRKTASGALVGSLGARVVGLRRHAVGPRPGWRERPRSSPGRRARRSSTSRRSSVAPLEQDVPAAAAAAQADVGAEPVDEPRVAAARMRPAEADDVAE